MNKKSLKRSFALTLALVMVMTLFMGVSAKAEEPETGLVIGWSDWDENGNLKSFDDINSFDAELGVPIKNDNTVALAMKNGDERTPLSSTAAPAIYDGENQQVTDSDIASITPYIGENGPVEGFFNIRIEVPGDYTVRYNEYSVAVNAGLPRVGIYSGTTIDATNFIGMSIDYLDEDTYVNNGEFYILTYDETEGDTVTWERIITGCVIYDGAEDVTADFVTLEPVGTDNKGYKVTINEDVRNYFTIEVSVQERDPNDPEFEPETSYDYMEFRGSNDDGPYEEEVGDGLVIGWAWDDPQQTFTFGGEDGSFHKQMGGISIKNGENVSLGIKTTDAEENSTVVPIGLDKIDKFSLTDEEGNPVEGFEITECVFDDGEGNEITEAGLFSLYLPKAGNYLLTYDTGNTKDNPDDYVINISANMPGIAAYSSEEVNEESLIGRRVVYKSAERTYYINSRDDEGDGRGTTRTITGYRIIKDDLPEDYMKDMVTVEPTDNGYKVTIAENRQLWFSIAVEFTQTDYWYEDGEKQENSWDSEEWIDFNFDENEDLGGGLWLDGAPQAGFSGTYISEDMFKYGVYNDAIDGNSYFVHAATVQEVIDKLSEVAIGDTVPGYIIDFESGTIKLDKNTKVTNTGYISISPSQYGDKQLAPQYVASSGNLHGIRFGNATYAYFIKEDEEGIYTEITGMSGAAGDYVEIGVDDPIRFLEFEGDKITSEQRAVFEDLVDSEDGLIEWKGKFYRAERHDNSYTNRDGIEIDDSYFTFGSAEPILEFDSDEAYEDFMEIYNDFLDKYADYLVDTHYQRNEYRRGDIMPGLHVNLYCDMQFDGDMGNLIIGYPDESLTDGKQYEATIMESDVEITGPDSYPDDTLIASNGGPFGHTTYNLRTYAISSELGVGGTATGVTAVVPEPNALSEMSYEQKDAIEAGAKLTVDVTADKIDAGGALDNETKQAVDSIVDATGKSADSMEFLDFTVDASVAGVAGSTQITETVVPMMITIRPKKPINKNSGFRIARYHKGVVDYLNLVDSLYGEIAGLNIGYVINDDGTITFLTDRFSVYAIEGEAEKPEPEPKTSTGTVSSKGIYVYEDNPAIVAGLVHEKSDAKDDVEFRWIACETGNPEAWFEISPWTKNNEWLNWTPEAAGNYVIVCQARVVGNEDKSTIQEAAGVVYKKNVIKGICQMPWWGEGGGYLIGIESYKNPNQAYSYELLILDCTLLIEGKDAWIYSTGRCNVSEGNAFWAIWQPQYGYYWTLFRVYDENGNIIGQECYGFANVN